MQSKVILFELNLKILITEKENQEIKDRIKRFEHEESIDALALILA